MGGDVWVAVLRKEFATGALIVGLCFFWERFPEKRVSRKGDALHAVAIGVYASILSLNRRQIIPLLTLRASAQCFPLKFHRPT